MFQFLIHQGRCFSLLPAPFSNQLTLPVISVGERCSATDRERRDLKPLLIHWVLSSNASRGPQELISADLLQLEGWGDSTIDPFLILWANEAIFFTAKACKNGMPNGTGVTNTVINIGSKFGMEAYVLL